MLSLFPLWDYELKNLLVLLLQVLQVLGGGVPLLQPHQLAQAAVLVSHMLRHAHYLVLVVDQQHIEAVAQVPQVAT
jgi:hypothetical protein